jgi:CheY-like chemotaxis protein
LTKVKDKTMNAPILIIEDSPDDYEAISSSLIRAGVQSDQLVHFNDGAALAEFQKSAHERPGMILLDLHLPGPSGHAILSQIRRDEQLSLVPVVMMSTSTASSDINLAYAGGANSYVVKPMSLDGFDVAMEKVKSYWLDTVRLPLYNPA